MSGISTNGLPAATTPLTGNETIAADTNLPQGGTPESEKVTVNQLSNYWRAPVALTDAATIATDASLGLLYTVTLGGNRTLANPTNLQSGQEIRFQVTQDGTGARTLAYGTLFKFNSNGSTLTTTAGAIDQISAVYNGTVLLANLQTKYA